MPARLFAILSLCALTVLGLLLAWPAYAAERPHGEPTRGIPYNYDEEAPPRLIGIYIGLALLAAAVAIVVGVQRHRRRRDDRARWRSVQPDAIDEEDVDPWMARDAVLATRALVREVRELWVAGDADWLREIAGPEVVDRWAPMLERAASRATIDEQAGARVSFVAALDAPADEAERVVVHVETATRPLTAAELAGSADPPSAAWTVLGRTLRRVRRRSRDRAFAEFWTLAGCDGDWTLLRTEPDRTAPPSRAMHGAPPWRHDHDGRAHRPAAPAAAGTEVAHPDTA
jgi:hypothetical protein